MPCLHPEEDFVIVRGEEVCGACRSETDAPLPVVPRPKPPLDQAAAARLDQAIRRADSDGRRVDAVEFRLALQRLLGAHEPGRRPGRPRLKVVR